VACIAQPDAGVLHPVDLTGASSRPEFLPSEGITASLAHRSINRGWSRPWLVLNASGDFVFMLESAWEPSN